MSRPKMNPNIRKVAVTITLTPIVAALAKNHCYQDGISLSGKIDELLAAYCIERAPRTPKGAIPQFQTGFPEI